MPQTPLGCGCMVAPISPCPSPMMSINALRSSASMIARRSSGLSKGGFSRLVIAVRLVFQLLISQLISGASFLISFISDTAKKARPGAVELLEPQCQDPGRGVADDGVFD